MSLLANFIEANIVDLQTLFGPDISYRIPQFQRPYAWGEEAQWKPLWDDVCSVAIHLLNRKVDSKIQPHFMGAIVLQHQKSNTGEVTKRLVVDGQQRLTTLQLLIRATEQAFQSQDDTIRATRLSKLTINQESRWDGDSKNKTKIRQSNRNDQTAFHTAIVDDYSDNSHQSIAEAYTYFKAEVNKWLNDDPNNRTARANALEDTLTKYLQIAAIDLREDEKPHIIFETLNARSEPLKQSDLIKNTVMYKANVINDNDAQKARKLWGMFEDQWWREESEEPSKRTHIDRFLNYWMVMRTHRKVTPGEVARRFRDYIEKKNRIEQVPIEVVAEDIRRAGNIYKDLETIKIAEIETFLKRIKAMKLGVATPLLLWLYISEVSDEQRLRSLKALESCLVRQMLCGTYGLNEIFIITLLDTLENPDAPKETVRLANYNVDYPSDTIVERLSTDWPTDRDLYESLTTNPMRGRGTDARKKMILEAVEMCLRSDEVEPLGDTDKLTIEHIMPEKWQQNWPLPLDKEETEAVDNRNKSVKSIGNLTLTTRKLNAKLSNNPWTEKRKTLGNHSSLFLNKRLLNDAPIWDEAAIEQRSRDLAKIIMRIWPSAETFSTTSV